jgi:hypothetical protein
MADSLFGGLTSIGDKFNELANVEFLNLDAMLEEQEKQEALDEFEDEEFDEIEQMLVTEDSNAQYQEPQKYDDSAQQEEVARNESGMTTGQGMALPRSSVAAEESQWDWTETEENSKTKTQSLPETSSDIQEGSNISHVPDSSLVGGPSDSAHSTSDPEPKLIPSAQSLQKAPLDAANLTQLVRPALCSTAGAAIVAKGASSPSRNTGVMKIRKTSAGPGGDPSMHGDGGNVRSQKETMVIIGGTDTEVNMADNLRASVAAARGAGRAARKKKKKKKKNRGSLDFWGIESGIESASQELSAVMDRATASVDSNSGETPQASSERAAAAADPSSSSSMPFLASKEPKLKTLSDRMASGSLVAGVLASLQATTSTFFDDDAEEDVENDSVAKQVGFRHRSFPSPLYLLLLTLTLAGTSPNNLTTPLPTVPLFSSILFSSLLFSSLLFSTLLFSSLLFSSDSSFLFSSLLFSSDSSLQILLFSSRSNYRCCVYIFKKYMNYSYELYFVFLHFYLI